MAKQIRYKSSFNVGYLTKEGFRNVKSNKLMSMASIAVLTSCLVLIGCAVMIFININAMLENIEDQNVIMVYLEDNLTKEQVNKVYQDIKMIPTVEEATFVDKETAYAKQLKEMGEQAKLLEGLEKNPLPNAYKVTLASLDNYDNVLKLLKSVNNTIGVRGNSNLAGQVRDIRAGVTYISLGIIVMLLAVSLFIIANTVRVTMYNRRLEISIMKAVGATNWFIRWPFIIEGVVIGVIASFVSLALVFGIYQLVINSLGTLFTLFGTTSISFLTYALPLLVAFLFIGVSAGIFGSIFSMARYLKEQGSVVNDDNE
ncbi:MAG: ABC transporter permease [Ruminococcaceae bacterium]|nr:ABC transporter permease [Oscillospiraceae bacterium]